ncbi:helix-turn-helix transcriptional regulator [Flavisphingomonas formosensis]|uniref:helix-turn-helix transcriptional regulator n=1 Tax=Flavisphingomonas formosensis TaxID=861534 RepID=UPI0012F9EFB3|nr:helix-turn-helix transcriptional regulator [Sphingomonas formosensis]
MGDVEQLYAAIEDDRAFYGLSESVAAFCGTRSAVVTHLDSNGALRFGQMNYWPAEAFGRYYSEYLGSDPWRQAAVTAGRMGTPIILDKLLPPSAFLRTPMYNELMKPLGDDTASCLGMFSPPGGDTLIVSVHRPYGAAEFDEGDAERLRALHGHVDRILRLRRLVERERSEARGLRHMVDASGRAILRVDRQLRIHQASAAAVAVLDAADGLAVRGGCFAVEDGVAAQGLRLAVQDVIDRGPATRTAFLCRRPSFRRSYRVLVLPGGTDPLDGALLLIDDPEETRDVQRRGSRLRQAYGFTQAETVLAEGLLAGLTLEEIAAERQVGRETIRTQLRSLFQRTDTRRQSDLIALLAGMPG